MPSTIALSPDSPRRTVFLMAMSREQTAGLSHTMKVDNSSIERVEEFKYLGKTLKNKNSIHEEIKIEVRECLLQLGAEPFFFQFAIQKFKIKLYRTIILPVVLYGCETWSLTLREEHRLRVFENRVLRRIIFRS